MPPRNTVRLRKISIRPEPVEGRGVRDGWFDRLTTNG